MGEAIVLSVIISFFAGWAFGEYGNTRTRYLHEQADKGLTFCKVGENYVWLTKAEYERLCLTDRSE
jgi:hypothetical protein